jgi:hypothetical protein
VAKAPPASPPASKSASPTPASNPIVLRPRLVLGRYRTEKLDWWNTIDAAKYGSLIGGEPAGGRMTKYLRPSSATFYAERVDPRLIADLHLRADEDGNVEILRRFWAFDGEDSALTPAPLVYADLMATGDGRCIETAKLVYDRLFASTRSYKQLLISCSRSSRRPAH